MTTASIWSTACRIMKPKRIDQLRSNAVVHVVNKMPGGGRKKDRRKTTQADQNSTEKSSSEVDMAFAVMEADSRSGGNGWNENLIQKMMELDHEAIEDIMEKLKNRIKIPMEAGPESGIGSALEGPRKLVHERKQGANTQQEET